MIAFLIFLALMVTFIVGGVYFSLHLYVLNRTGHLSERQLVTLSREAFIESQPDK